MVSRLAAGTEPHHRLKVTPKPVQDIGPGRKEGVKVQPVKADKPGKAPAQLLEGLSQAFSRKVVAVAPLLRAPVTKTKRQSGAVLRNKRSPAAASVRMLTSRQQGLGSR